MSYHKSVMDEDVDVSFCDACHNLLYPVAKGSEMYLHCKLCGTDLPSGVGSVIMHRVDLRADAVTSAEPAAGGAAATSSDLRQLAAFVHDATVMKTKKKCERPTCSGELAACFINPLTKPDTDMSLFYACVRCEHVWTEKAYTPTAAAQSA
jgi:DNA-directed RNA polymerase subunit M/transcription elongation factor TFIIS